MKSDQVSFPAAGPDGSARYEHFPHHADIGVRGMGATMEQAFEQAALALAAVITEPATVRPEQAVDIQVQAPDPELLLADWLNGLIYEMAVRNMLFSRFRVSIADDRLRGTAWGEVIDPSRHERTVEAKGATFTQLKVSRDAGGRWLAQCVIDV